MYRLYQLALICLLVVASVACSFGLEAGQGVDISQPDASTALISGVDASYYTKGIAEFNPGNFSVVDGAVSLLGNISAGGGVDDDSMYLLANATAVDSDKLGGAVAGTYVHIIGADVGSINASDSRFDIIGDSGVISTSIQFGGTPAIKVSHDCTACQIQRVAAQNILYQTYDQIDFDTEIYEHGYCVNQTGNGSIRVTYGGLYLVKGAWEIQNLDGKYACIYPYVNGVMVDGLNYIGSSALYPTIWCEWWLYLNAGDEVSLYGWQDIANPRALYVGGGRVRLTVIRVQ